jgi:hypothetical protein
MPSRAAPLLLAIYLMPAMPKASVPALLEAVLPYLLLDRKNPKRYETPDLHKVVTP